VIGGVWQTSKTTSGPEAAMGFVYNNTWEAF
jgi:hypothetical protein